MHLYPHARHEGGWECLYHGCPSPVLNSWIPARFSIPPGRKLFSKENGISGKSFQLVGQKLRAHVSPRGLDLGTSGLKHSFTVKFCSQAVCYFNVEGMRGERENIQWEALFSRSTMSSEVRENIQARSEPTGSQLKTTEARINVSATTYCCGSYWGGVSWPLDLILCCQTGPREDSIEDTVVIFFPLGHFLGCRIKSEGFVQALNLRMVAWVHAVICFVFLTDDNCRELGPSKDISGFPEHPPFSFSAKNRKLRVSWDCTFPMKLNGRSFLQTDTWCPRPMRLNSSFSLRSFDTESEGSRWVPVSQTTGLIVWTFVPVCCAHQHDGDLTYISGWFKRVVHPLTSPLWILFSKLSHQPALLFLRDPYLLPSAHGEFRAIFQNVAASSTAVISPRNIFSYLQTCSQMLWSKVWCTEFSTQIFIRGRGAEPDTCVCRCRLCIFTPLSVCMSRTMSPITKSFVHVFKSKKPQSLIH